MTETRTGHAQSVCRLGTPLPFAACHWGEVWPGRVGGAHCPCWCTLPGASEGSVCWMPTPCLGQLEPSVLGHGIWGQMSFSKSILCLTRLSEAGSVFPVRGGLRRGRPWKEAREGQRLHSRQDSGAGAPGGPSQPSVFTGAFSWLFLFRSDPCTWRCTIPQRACSKDLPGARQGLQRGEAGRLPEVSAHGWQDPGVGWKGWGREASPSLSCPALHHPGSLRLISGR